MKPAPTRISRAAAGTGPARWAAAVAIAALVLALSGCGQAATPTAAASGGQPPASQGGSAGGGRATAPPSSAGPGSARPSAAGSATSSTSESGPGSGGASGQLAARAPVFCQAHQASVASVVGRKLPDSGQSELVPLGASASGTVAYVSAWTSGFTGVAQLKLKSGRLRPIKRFANPASDQADGTSDGQWLVFAETYSLNSLDRFTMYAFNEGEGRLRRIGHSLAEPAGQPWPSPWHAPAVSGSFAAWAQGYGPGGKVEIELANLATGTTVSIARGHLQPPFFDGGLVVWPESDHPGSQTSLRAYSLTEHAAATLPAVLAGVHGTDFVVTDGTRTAYLSPDFTRLYYSPGQDVLARPVVRLPAGTDFTDLALAPGSLAWTTSDATYLASTRTGTFVQVTPRYGYATGSGSVMLITDAPEGKAVHPALPTYVVKPASFDWPACPAA